MKNAPRTSTFQSTLSVRRATGDQTQCHRDGNISIHALRKESDRQTPPAAMRSIGILIHALRKESDLLRERRNAGHVISIHALRKESDPLPTHRRPSCAYFNPRSP